MRVLLALFPFVLMLVLWRRRLVDWRERFIIISVLWASYAVILTELLSVLNRLTPAWVSAGWCIASLLVFAATWWGRGAVGNSSPPAADTAGQTKFMFVPQIVLIAGVLALVAWIGPPNNWDSMAYHLPRIIHWIQDRNVAFYPTASLRQLELPPGAEHLILQLQLLSSCDRWDNLVQWFAYVGCIIAVSAVAGLLGGGTLAQVLAATFAATLPIACLESVTTQNDAVSAFWFVCFIWFIFRIRQRRKSGDARPHPTGDYVAFALCGASLGLALLTKTTMYVLCAPFGVALIGLALRRFGIRAISRLLLFSLIAIALNAPTFCRNHRFSHTFLGNGGYGAPGPYVNVHPGVAAAASNILRNLGLEFAMDPPVIARSAENIVRLAHQWMQLNPDDPDTTLGFDRYTLVGTIWSSEDHAPNPFHVLLILAAGMTMLVRWRKRNWLAGGYGLAIAAGFVLFCGYLRMQPWHCRLHLPLLVASGAFVGVVMEGQWKHGIAITVGGLLPLLVMPWIFTDYLHPLCGANSIFAVPRQSAYFAERNLEPQYDAITDFAQQHHVKQVGLICDGDSWEYPLQVMLRDRVAGVRIEAYPSRHTWPADALHTRNKGFDRSVKPYAVVSLVGNSAGVVDFVGR